MGLTQAQAQEKIAEELGKRQINLQENGKTTAQIVLYKFRADICLINGISITCLGNAIAQTISVNNNIRPLNLFLASAYPAIAAVIQVKIIAITAINTVFISHLAAAGSSGPASNVMDSPFASLMKGTPISNIGATCLLKSFLKLSNTISLGISSGIGELIDFAVLNAPVKIQYNGNVKSIASMTSTAMLIIL